MAFDEARGRVVLFGGLTESQTFLDDTWEWNGATWTQVGQGSPRPPARAGAAMAYDAERRRIVLFGGRGSDANDLGDTWEFDGQRWVARTPATAPSARSGHVMAFDPTRRTVLLFGGLMEEPASTETWEWTGLSWARLATSGPRGPRAAGSLVADPVRRRLVLFGGISPGPEYLSDTWEWNGTTWASMSAAGPGERFAHVSAFDGSRVVVFGGRPASDSSVWAFDGSRWSTAGSAFGGLVGGGMTFDSMCGRLVLFGGQSMGQMSGSTYERGPSGP